jgi:hypothetical protein
MTKKHYHTSHSEKEKEDWMNSKWRPMMGWMYMIVCTCDFMLFPVLWSLLQSLSHGQVNSQWQPLTLQGAGLFHLAMGAVLGIAAYGRTQEKLNGANNGGLTQQGLGTTYVPPGQGQFNVSNQAGFGGNAYGNATTPATGFATGSSTFGSAPTTGFGSPGSFGTPTLSPEVTWPTISTATAAVTTGYGGKKKPPEPVFPEL